MARSIEGLTASYLEELAQRTPASHALREEAERVLAGGVSSHFKAWQPFYVREARGAHLTDVDGNDYVDLVMGFGPNPLGHSPRCRYRRRAGDGRRRDESCDRNAARGVSSRRRSPGSFRAWS